jgi:hypothetical protein
VIVQSARKASGIKKGVLVAVPITVAAVLVLGGVLIVKHKSKPAPTVVIQPQPAQETLPPVEPVKEEVLQTHPQGSDSPAKEAELQKAAQPLPPKAEPVEVVQPSQADEPQAVAVLPTKPPPPQMQEGMRQEPTQFQPEGQRQPQPPPPPEQDWMWKDQPQQPPPPGEQGEFWNQEWHPPAPEQDLGGQYQPQQPPAQGGQPEQWGEKWQPPPEDAYGKPVDGSMPDKGPQDPGRMQGNLPPVRKVPEEFKKIEIGLFKSDPHIHELAKKGLWKDLKDYIWQKHLDEVDKMGKVIRARREEVLTILAGHLKRRIEMERLYGEQWPGEKPQEEPPPQQEEFVPSPPPPE